MGSIWFSSDLHLGHSNIIKHCNRPFKDVDEMDQTLIDNWNSRIGDRDRVYLLGDFTFKNVKGAQEYLDQLNGTIHFIKGNHDTKYSSLSPSSKLVLLGEYHELRYNKRKYVLCHYPFESWNGSYRGSIHLHGHCHGSLGVADAPDGFSGPGRLDVGVDCHNFYPISLEQVHEYLE